MEKFRTKVFDLNFTNVDEDINKFLETGIEIRRDGFFAEGKNLVVVYYPPGSDHQYTVDDLIRLQEEVLNTLISTDLLPALVTIRRNQDELDKKLGGKARQEELEVVISANEKNVAKLRADIAATRAVLADLREGKIEI